MEFLNVVPDEADEVGVKFDPQYWKAFEYEKRLELALTEKERADAVKLIADEFRKRLQHGSKISQ